MLANMANICGRDSLRIKFKIDFLKLCLRCVPGWNIISSILLAFAGRPFLLIEYKFLVIVSREYLNITF